MAQPPTLSLFELAAGSGMLGAGVKLALDVLGLHAEVAGAVEWDSEAAAVLLAGLEVAQGCRPPVYDDAKRWFGRHAWRDLRRLEPVDVLVAGYPCQPFSHAGKRGGSSDPRHLWPAVRRAVAGLQPGIVFFENVPGHLSIGLGKVLADLRRLGFRTSCGVYSAEEVGASQIRKRLFILGVTDGGRGRKREPGARSEGRGPAGGSGSAVADGFCGGWGTSGRDDEGQPEPAQQGQAVAFLPCGGLGGGGEPSGGPGQPPGGQQDLARSDCPDTGPGGQDDQGGTSERRGGPSDDRPELADGDGAGMEGGRPSEPGGDRGPDIGGRDLLATMPPGRFAESPGEWIDWGHIEYQPEPGGGVPQTIFPPGPHDYDAWADAALGGLDPAYMPAAQRGVPVVADGLATRASLLRIGGNGVVPLCAARAFVEFFACVMDELVDPSEAGPLFDLGGAQ